MGYITERKNPEIGNAYKDILSEPNRASNRKITARIVNQRNTTLLSNIFNRSSPRIPPMVINPQK